MAEKQQPKEQRCTVLITGCSYEGLGEALAFAFHSQGLRVFATARRMSTMDRLRRAGIETFELDVTNELHIISVKDRILELTGGKLDILVNNAGQSYPYAVADASLDKVKELFDVNFFAAWAMVQAFLPLLMASEHARIVQMGSIAGLMPVPFGAAYNCSKAALHALGDTMRVELAPLRIKVITIVLGNVHTHIIRPGHQLPATSLYLPIEEEYQARRLDKFQIESSEHPGPVSEQIVAEVLKLNPSAWWWGGQYSWLTWLVHTFLGRRGFDWLLTVRFGLNKLACRVAHEAHEQKETKDT